MVNAGITPLSVLVERQRVEAVGDIVDDHTDVFVVDRETMTKLAGFAIHTGVLAVAERPASISVDALITRANQPLTLVACSRLKETANLGAIVRTAAALGATGMLLGPECCDPYYRRAVRVSMGAVFNLPIVRSDDLAADLRRLRAEHGVRCYAAVLEAGATPLPEVRRPERAALVLGHEVEGIEPDTRQACDEPVTIPMHHGTDSLNVSASAALLIYHMVHKPATPEAT
jgi:tRNA G18 (ribose-2'-O)-methylase SpoU